MPRFSVIVPVFKVQGFLRECLDSVLGQSFDDLEVIAVDDCSPDGCGAILDEYAARDPRLRAVHLPENVGLGRARNAGLPHATGDYVLFLDSDDRYTPGLLRAVADRLDVTGDPDILVFDHVRTHWWGRAGRSDAADLFEQAGTDTFDLRTNPEYLGLFLVAWNKAYRRDFFLGHGFRYRPGLYEDAPVTYQTMVTAERIACLDRVGVEYRQRRQGAITRTPGRKHFDIFDQYEGLFAFLAERPGLDWARPLLFERALDHMLFTVARPERVLRGDRREFHRRIRAFYRTHVPPGFVPPPESRRTEIRLLALAPYSAHRGLGALRGAGRAAGRRTRRTRDLVVRRLKRCWYRIQLRRPLDPGLAVYSAGHSRAVNGDPHAIHSRAAELAPQVRGVWVVRPDAVGLVPPGTEYVTTGSWRYYRVMARAGHWINDCNWAGDLVKRPGSVHVQTHRGTPLKYMALDLLDRPGARHGTNVRGMLRRSDRWDVSLVANRHSEEIWQRAYPCHFTSLRSGSPRNDVLVRGGEARAAEVRERLGAGPAETVVLYAPTPRDYRRGRHVGRVGLEALAASLGPGHRLLVRLHPGLARHHERALLLRDLHRRGVLTDVTDEPHVEDVLLASDALITDYAALMFDYANLDRPIVIHADDWAAYRAARGAYFDITAEPPGHVTRSDEELAKVFTSGAWRDTESTRLRAAFRERFCEYDDGRAAERVVRRILLGETPDTKGGGGVVDGDGGVVRIPAAVDRSARLPEYS
ncbi:bifunctional glycosyltransferase family 2 protein/CDP-glycerol:glycerophosphate glycerophosphotransferase [Streptomyces sp. NBC_01485]|uniref:bifunctional glycosyltransferase/CDP-glycerol:glycerophosphate glycerophosphotransferase n=1 Tax=Streptomyces sp. NBC_01485 TaxID=2903884 RepID=UPI002E3679FE|nr:bifunctional glycosyltransferase family 2 protein/CDP-glycerol:glycerophosphate glycerophosphotransferase [Streptomyces sp. NBC_01485]